MEWVTRVLGPRCKKGKTKLHTVLPDKSIELLKKVSGGRGADDIVVAVAVRDVQINAQQWLARGGVLNLFAGLKRGEHVIDLDTIRVHYDDIKVVGSSGGAPSDIAETLRMVAAREFDPAQHMTMVGSLDQLPRALEMVKNTETDGKIVLYPHIRPIPLTPARGWTAKTETSFLAANEVLTA